MCQVRPRGGTRARAPSPRGQGHFLEAPATLPYGRAKPGDQESVDGAWPLAEASWVGWGPLWLRLGLELLLPLPVGYHSCLPHPCSCLGPQSLLQLRHPPSARTLCLRGVGRRTWAWLRFGKLGGRPVLGSHLGFALTLLPQEGQGLGRSQPV